MTRDPHDEDDLRCLDAHAHLGNLAFDHWPQEALRHYAVGLRIGELSVGGGMEAGSRGAVRGLSVTP